MRKILGLALLLVSTSAFGGNANRGFTNQIDVYSNGTVTKSVPVQIAIDGSNLPFLFSAAPTWLNVYFIEDQNGKKVPNSAAAVRFFFDISTGEVTAINNPLSIDYKKFCIQLEAQVFGGYDANHHEIWSPKVRRVLGAEYQSGQEVSLFGPDECSLSSM